MKKTLLMIGLLAAMLLSLKAQLIYHNADLFPLGGKISDDTETRYERLPSYLRGVTRQPVWDLGKNTAGLYLRFASDATTIGLKWTLYENRIMNHMTATGIKGFDLYSYTNGKWVFVNSARPQPDAMKNEAVIVSNMKKEKREYLLYFPLYDGVTELEIGIDSLTTISQPEPGLLTSRKPVVCYGTSILQGGCASRAGMAHTNILVRRLNREFINLGFSGNGQLDYEIAGIMAGCDASVFVLDFMPNVNVKQIEEKMEKFYSIIRSKAPLTPILFIENPVFPQGTFDLYMQNTVAEKNKALHKIFDTLAAKGDKNIRIISSAAMIGYDNEATVDGIHFTDLGFMRYADYLYPYIKQYLDE